MSKDRSKIDEQGIHAIISQKIRLARKIAGLSQEEVADRINMRVQAYCKLEKGQGVIDVFCLYKIALVLDTPLEMMLPSSADFAALSAKS